MAWSPLAARFANMPLILAGPMLRQVTPRRVTVWVALKERADVTLNVDGASTGAFSATLGTTRIGPNLHLVAVTAMPEASTSMQSGDVYQYDLSFSTDARTETFGTALGDDVAETLAYSPFAKPSFVLPPEDLNDLRLIQGSCRKPNGGGYDAFTILDQLLQASADAPLGRPHQLLLTGDQIYADEVADVLLLMLTDAAELLCGVEGVPITETGAESLANDYPPMRRSNVIKAAGLTTVDTRSHLMSFGEWMAMYLFVWSDVLWPDKNDVPSFWDVKAVVQAKLDQQGVSDEEREKIISEILHTRLDTDPVQRDQVLTLFDALPKVRRALANIPTYMILDDHDVTDDWNMNRSFCESVYGHPMGRTLIQNGVVAYALCQHWGNTPEQFVPNAAGAAGATLLSLFTGATGGYNDIRDNPNVAKIVGVHSWTEMAAWTPPRAYHDTGVRWAHPEGWVDSATLIYNYTIEGPGHQVIVTDSRTWRELPHGAYEQPHLIAKDQIAVQIANTLRNIDGRLLIVVLSTNAPPMPGIRQGGRDAPKLPFVGSDFYFYDFYDSWELEHVDWAQLVAAIARKFPLSSADSRDGYALFLSGDVHSSSAQRIQIWSESQIGDSTPYRPARLVVAQLVGSSMRNEDWKTIGQHDSTNGYSWIPPKLMAKIAKQKILLTEGFVGWNVDAGNDGDVLGVESSYGPGGWDLDDYRLDTHRPTRTLRTEVYPPLLYTLNLDSVSRTPDHRIRLDYLKAVAGSGYVTEPIVLDIGDAKKRRAQAARKYHTIVKGGYKKEIVGRSNLGEITFEQPSGGVITAKYTVRWQWDSITTLYVRWDVSLDVADGHYPKLLGP